MFTETRLMGEIFDFANWFSVKEEVVYSLGQQSLNLGDWQAVHCGWL